MRYHSGNHIIYGSAGAFAAHENAQARIDRLSVRADVAELLRRIADTLEARA